MDKMLAITLKVILVLLSGYFSQIFREKYEKYEKTDLLNEDDRFPSL